MTLFHHLHLQICLFPQIPFIGHASPLLLLLLNRVQHVLS